MVGNVQPGADVGRVLQRAVDRIRRQLDEHVAGVSAIDKQVNDLVARRGGAPARSRTALPARHERGDRQAHVRRDPR